jgi:hypothetical protein
MYQIQMRPDTKYPDLGFRSFPQTLQASIFGETVFKTGGVMCVETMKRYENNLFRKFRSFIAFDIIRECAAAN